MRLLYSFETIVVLTTPQKDNIHPLWAFEEPAIASLLLKPFFLISTHSQGQHAFRPYTSCAAGQRQQQHPEHHAFDITRSTDQGGHRLRHVSP